ncbi:hypothetical protein VU12_13235 [Desulfobulbus sp. US4]|nr:hypothetical protein [Desulfobulbus sp. US4]
MTLFTDERKIDIKMSLAPSKSFDNQKQQGYRWSDLERRIHRQQKPCLYEKELFLSKKKNKRRKKTPAFTLKP